MDRAQGIAARAQIAEALASGLGIAWIRHGDEIRWAQGRRPGAIPHSGMDSAVVALIEAIYEAEPRWSLSWLRERLHTTEPMGVASAATVQVAARRVSWEQEIQDLLGQLEQVAQVGQVSALRPPHPDFDPDLVLEQVSASVIQGQDTVLCAQNQARRIRTRHAEVELMRGYLQSSAASEAGPIQIRVSLKCCKMCAAWIFEALAQRRDFCVIYDEPDPGRLARSTALEAGSPQRRLAVQVLGLGPEWIGRELEFRRG